MSRLESLGRQVGRKIKIRGADYFGRKAVRILFVDGAFASAQVSGSRKYSVDLERERDRLIFSCDCPFFEENYQVCKHVWATLLELDNQGHLKKWEPQFPDELVPIGSEEDIADEDFEDFDIEDLGDFSHAMEATDGLKSTGKLPPALKLHSWKHLLEKIDPLPDSKMKRLSWPAGREILYVIEPAWRYSYTALAIQVEVRDRRKNGEWKNPKPLSLSHDMLPELPDPADREILARLIGVKRDTWYQGADESICRFQPKNHELFALLPLISKTERLFIRALEAKELHTVQWDESGIWEFRLDVRSDEQGKQYEIRGAFFRSSERLDISQPTHIFPEGIFLLGSTISAFRGSHAWISFFRTEGSFFVPFGEADQCLETMLGMPAIPPIDLPVELQLEEIDVTPRPILRISFKKEAWGIPYLAGELLFDYLDHIIEEQDSATGITLVPERKRILRSTGFENLARQKLEDAGFRWQCDHSGRGIWTAPQSRLPAAARLLVAAGWHVEAEGKLFRKPESLNLRIASGIDWFELHGTVDFGDSRVALPRLLAALKRHENTIRLDDGSFGMLPEDWLQKYELLAGLGTAHEDHVRFKRNQAGLLDALLASRQEVRCDALFEHLRSELRQFAGVTAADAPEGFHGSLRPYQREGLGWMHFLQQFGFGGCLADDMGLGKTIQVLSLLEERRSLRHANGSSDRPPPSLVVLPRSLLFNWRQEAERFTPKMHILEHTGVERIRGHNHFDDYDVIFTTYGTLRRDAAFFREKKFDYVILDEAQAVKNASTESAKAVRLLKGHHRLALSGTPIENHLGELWSLFEFLNPGMLGSVSVFRFGKGPAAPLDEEHRALLARALRPFILRRTKAQVARDLPAKLEQTLLCRLEKAQRTLYDELRDHYRSALRDRIDREGIERSKIHILEALLRLRQAAIHPGLIDRGRIHEPSAKLDVLLPQLIEVVEEGHKALVFSQFTSMLSILRGKLELHKIRYEYLDGQTRDRAAPVDRFQNDPDPKLFLISLKAGGLGLNLTAAEYVFLLDPWWNPAIEAQAVDRTHRIGQTQPVFAYRLIAKDTVEEKVLELQETKRQIADAIINQDNSLMRNLNPEDLAILLS